MKCLHCGTSITRNPAGQYRDSAGDHHYPGEENCVRLLKSQLVIAKGALENIGKNTCGREPLAAAYARGILSEMAEAIR